MKKDSASIIREIVLHTQKTEDESIEYAKEMKALYPNKQDYGFGDAGHTLNDWQDMRTFFLEHGPVSYAAKSHKMISQIYRKMVGSIVDYLVSASMIDNSFLGQYCWFGTVEQFLKSKQDPWLHVMVSRYPLVSPFLLTSSIKSSWRTCYSPLKKALKSLGQNYSNILLAFEFVLPQKVKNGAVCILTRPDVLLISKKIILVLEFKDKPLTENAVDQYLLQVQKYKHRLKQYHVESKGKQINCLLISTDMKGVLYTIKKGTFCSGDQLAEAIRTNLQSPAALTIPQMKRWLSSDFIGIQE